MNTSTCLRLSLALCTLAPLTTPAATNYVWQGSPSPGATLHHLGYRRPHHPRRRGRGVRRATRSW